MKFLTFFLFLIASLNLSAQSKIQLQANTGFTLSKHEGLNGLKVKDKHNRIGSFHSVEIGFKINRHLFLSTEYGRNSSNDFLEFNFTEAAFWNIKQGSINSKKESVNLNLGFNTNTKLDYFVSLGIGITNAREQKFTPYYNLNFRDSEIEELNAPFAERQINLIIKTGFQSRIKKNENFSWTIFGAYSMPLGSKGQGNDQAYITAQMFSLQGGMIYKLRT